MLLGVVVLLAARRLQRPVRVDALKNRAPIWLCLLGLACAQRVQGPYGIEGDRAADGYFYVVPVDGGVVLVDTGEQPDGALLQQIIAGRAVLGLLVTHAHHDHYAAAHLLGPVPTHVGPDDILRMKGVTQHQGANQVAWRAQNGGVDLLPPLPKELRPTVDGESVELGGARFTAIALPGHTPGSTAWLYRDVLFGGDAAMGFGTRIRPIDEGYSDDPPRALESLRKLKGFAFSTVLDGHRGRSSLGPDAVP